MKNKQAVQFIIYIVSIFTIFFIVASANLSINAAAVTAGKVSISILPPAPKTICGDGICDAEEICPADCMPKEEIRRNVAQIKVTYVIFIILIMIFCVLSYLYFKEDRPPIRGYWQYGFR